MRIRDPECARLRRPAASRCRHAASRCRAGSLDPGASWVSTPPLCRSSRKSQKIMSITSEADWEGLRQAADVARVTLDTLTAQVRAGVTTGDLDTTAAQLFAAHGARSAPALVYGFPGAVLISVNDEIVHGIPGTRRITAGDIVKIDVTVEKNGYVADAARSVVVEPASVTAHRLVACATAAFRAALTVAQPAIG
jgi:methionyl aminopeptidase